MADELDPKVAQRYRELRAEEPPRELDQAILAAAHRAADRAHAPLVAPAGRHRWYFAFGAVAILVLAVAITVQVERQPDPEALAPSTMSVAPDRALRFENQAEKETKEEVKPSKPLSDTGSPPPARERRKARAQQAAPAVPPVETKPEAAEAARADRLEPATPAPSQADSRDQPSGAAGMLGRQEQLRKSREAAPTAAPSPEVATRPQANMQESRGAVASIAPPLSPEQLLERVAELRKQGRQAEADKALEEFRKQYPDYRISEEMLRKVERPK